MFTIRNAFDCFPRIKLLEIRGSDPMISKINLIERCLLNFLLIFEFNLPL